MTAPTDEPGHGRPSEVSEGPSEVVARPDRFERRSYGLEFDRVAFFSDAIFAIAMTLLVVGIGIPDVPEADLADALRDKQPEIVSFFISFIVIGQFWRGHHQFFNRLGAVSPRLITVNLVYLAAIAFTPFPTALAGRYTDDPVSIVMYAIALAVASALEVVMFLIAARDSLFRTPVDSATVRFAVAASAVPAVVFAASIPVALVHTTYALASWLVIIPLEMVVDRRFRPTEGGEQVD